MTEGDQFHLLIRYEQAQRRAMQKAQDDAERRIAALRRLCGLPDEPVVEPETH